MVSILLLYYLLLCWKESLSTVAVVIFFFSHENISKALMSGEEVSAPVHLKGVQWGWGQGSVQAAQVLKHRPWRTMSLLITLHTGSLSWWNMFGPFSSSEGKSYKSIKRRWRQVCDNRLKKIHIWLWWSGVHLPLAIYSLFWQLLSCIFL